MTDGQYGFRSNHSTSLATTEFVEKVTSAIDYLYMSYYCEIWEGGREMERGERQRQRQRETETETKRETERQRLL